ncbi:MAG: DUF1517 domain-containing protein [Cyanobacteria bacterium P01_G01_bin.19]
MRKQISLKQTLIVFLFVMGFYSLSSTIVNSHEINNQSKNAIKLTQETKINEKDKSTQDFLLTKKTGGRSGGGSFSRSKPSPSKSNSGSQNSYSSPSNRSSDSNSYNSSSGSTDGESNLIGLAVIVGFIVIVCILVRLGIIETGSSSYQIYSASTSDTNYNAYDLERDNDIVTVSLLQIVLDSNQTADIKQNLNKLSIEVDTSTNEGLVKLMQETALILLRHQESWVYAFSSSESLDISQAEKTFERLSITERSKFSRETLNNVDGKLQTTQINCDQINRNQAYLVVTLIAGTADDKPLFEKIYVAEELKSALIKVASMRDDYLMKFELLWTPQQNNEYLTEEELLIEYSNLIMLA